MARLSNYGTAPLWYKLILVANEVAGNKMRQGLDMAGLIWALQTGYFYASENHDVIHKAAASTFS